MFCMNFHSTKLMQFCIDDHQPAGCLSKIFPGSIPYLLFNFTGVFLERICNWKQSPVLEKTRQLCIPIGSSNFDHSLDRRGNNLAFSHLPISKIYRSKFMVNEEPEMWLHLSPDVRERFGISNPVWINGTC